MHIAIVAPLIEPVPPLLYGGTERVVSYLTEALVAAGHKVTLFASGDSVTKATLAASSPRALRLHTSPDQHDNLHVVHVELVALAAADFDIVHLHNQYLHVPTLKRLGVRYVVTQHISVDSPEFRQLDDLLGHPPLVSISNRQQQDLPHGNFVSNVYHGLPPDHLPLGDGDGGYIAFLGSIRPDKGPDIAVRIAAKAHWRLKIAAKLDEKDKPFFDTNKPLFDQPHVVMIGEIEEKHKAKFLGEAAVLLFPSTFPEPFGLAMIEAMACGTPVIGFDVGSVSEVIDEGITGFVVQNEDEAVEAVAKAVQLKRDVVRAHSVGRFNSHQMAKDYVATYEKVIREAELNLASA